MKRNAKGQIIGGGPLTDAEKAAISKGLVEREHRITAELGVALSGVKRCTICGELKTWDARGGVDSEYVMRSRPLKSGGVRRYPEGACKECAARRSAAYRKRTIARVGREKFREMQKGWNDNREPENRKRYQREYSTMRRREAGVAVRGPWKKYRKEDRSGNEGVSAEPLIRWVEDLDQGQVEDSVLMILRNARRTGTITLAGADRVLTAFNATHMLEALYGEVGDGLGGSRGGRRGVGRGA